MSNQFNQLPSESGESKLAQITPEENLRRLVMDDTRIEIERSFDLPPIGFND